MREILKLVILLIFTTQLISARELPAQKDIIYDEANLLSFSFRKRMGHYLKNFRDHNSITLKVILLESLQGESIQEYGRRYLEQQGDEDGNTVAYMLSLSDRKFIVLNSPSTKDIISDDMIATITEGSLSYIKRNRFEQSIVYFADQTIFHIDETYKETPPPVGQKGFANIQGLIFFLIVLIVTLSMGRKLFTGKVLYTNLKQNRKGDNLKTPEMEDFAQSVSPSQGLKIYICEKSDLYPAAHFRLSLLFTLFSGMILYFTPWDFYDPIWYLYVQIPALIIGYLFAGNLRLKKAFTTSGEMKEESYQKALEIFHKNNLSQNEVLLFISMMEKAVHVISLNQSKKDIFQASHMKKIKRAISKKNFSATLSEVLNSLFSLAGQESTAVKKTHFADNASQTTSSTDSHQS